MHNNTVKQGKEQQILTIIGHSTFLNVCEYLNGKQLVNLMAANKYTYEVIKERDEVWCEQWQRIYQSKFQNKIKKIKNDYGQTMYGEMCIKAYMMQNRPEHNDWRDKSAFYRLASRQMQISFQSRFDVKQYLREHVSPTTFNIIFTDLRYSMADGYGPQDQWPRPSDNQQYLRLFNIRRRQIVQLDEQNAVISWMVNKPIQKVLIKLTNFYNQNTHRKKKQLIEIITRQLLRIFYGVRIYFIWDWFWQLSQFIGIKILVILYFEILAYFFRKRYMTEYRNWVSIHPLDIKEDFIQIYHKIINYLHQKSISVKNYIVQTMIKKFIVRPAKSLYRKIKYVLQLFHEKVVHPLYIQISHKLVALWKIIKMTFTFTINILQVFFKFLHNLLVKTVSTMWYVVTSISTCYSKMLQLSLVFALKFGMFGQLVFTVIILTGMVSPSIACYIYYNQVERWFIILSTVLTMVLIVTGYKHLSRLKNKVLRK